MTVRVACKRLCKLHRHAVSLSVYSRSQPLNDSRMACTWHTCMRRLVCKHN